jgi:hypothetical protein
MGIKENQIKISASRDLKENEKDWTKKKQTGLFPPCGRKRATIAQQKLKIIATLRDGNAF